MVRQRRSQKVKVPSDFDALVEGFNRAYMSQEGQELINDRPYLADAQKLFLQLSVAADRDAEFQARGNEIKSAVTSLAKGLDVLVGNLLDKRLELNSSRDERERADAEIENAIRTRVMADGLPDSRSLARLDGMSLSASLGIGSMSLKYVSAYKQQLEQDKLTFTSQIEVARTK